MTKEERTQKWFVKIPQAEKIPLASKIDMCKRVSQKMLVVFLLLLAGEGALLYLTNQGGLIDSLAEVLNQASQGAPTVNHYKGLALLGILFCLPGLVLPLALIHLLKEKWLQEEVDKVLADGTSSIFAPDYLVEDAGDDWHMMSEKLFSDWALDNGEQELRNFSLEDVKSQLLELSKGSKDFVFLIPDQLIKLEQGHLVSDFVQVCYEEDTKGFCLDVSIADPASLNENVIYGTTDLRLEKVLAMLQELLEQRRVPDYTNWDIVVDMRENQTSEVETYLEIAGILTDDREVLARLKACFENPQRYFQENEDRYDERCIDLEDGQETIRWIGLVDELLESKDLVELDWQSDMEEFFYQLEPLAQKQGLHLNQAWLEEDGDIPLWARTLDQKWQSQGFCLAAMDIDSDSYVLFICQRAILGELVVLSKKINQRFDYAKNM